ncbi:MAG: helix-turn-helix transcriptional regulator [Clostridia bacterium]|nr:helix-turn-helix transcriptional regulator [Clostridia bacterium]
MRQNADDHAVVIGVLIQKQMFYRDFLPVVASDPTIFRFFLDPQQNALSEDFLHFSFQRESPVRSLLETMVMEYAHRQEDTQTVLKPLVSVLLLHIARRYRELFPQETGGTTAKKIMRYMGSHTDSVTLSALANHFSYHPNYISNLLRKDTGKSFSEILLQMRMERTVMLLQGTELSVEDISAMLGYADRSNFFKAFRDYYVTTPREYNK